MKPILRFSLLICLAFPGCDSEMMEWSILFSSEVGSLVNERQDSLMLQVTFDKNTLRGSYLTIAIDPTSTAQLGSDFVVSPVIEVPEGVKSFSVPFYVVNDSIFEEDEIVKFKLSGAGNLKIGSNVGPGEFTIADNDGYLRIDLIWDSGDGTPGDVDMDIFLWVEKIEGSSKHLEIVTWSQYHDSRFESISITQDAEDAIYLLTFRYYSGTSDNLNFTVRYTGIGCTLYGDIETKEFQGRYSLKNLNCCGGVRMEHVFEKDGTEFWPASEIFIPDFGSRVGGSNIIPPLKTKS